MSGLVNFTLGALVGAGAGLVAGAVSGSFAAYLAGYQSSLAQMMDAGGRKIIASTAIGNGRAVGGIVGLVCGAIAGALGNALIALFAFWLISKWFVRELHSGSDYVIGADWGICVGGYSGLFAGYFARTLIV